MSSDCVLELEAKGQRLLFLDPSPNFLKKLF